MPPAPSHQAGARLEVGPAGSGYRHLDHPVWPHPRHNPHRLRLAPLGTATPLTSVCLPIALTDRRNVRWSSDRVSFDGRVFPIGELTMTQDVSRRIALRAVQVAIVAAGIFFLLLLVSRQAHAATIEDHPAPALVTSALSAGPVAAGPVAAGLVSGSPVAAGAVTGPAGSVVGTVTSALGSATAPVTGAATGGQYSPGAPSGSPSGSVRIGSVWLGCAGGRFGRAGGERRYHRAATRVRWRGRSRRWFCDGSGEGRRHEGSASGKRRYGSGNRHDGWDARPGYRYGRDGSGGRIACSRYPGGNSAAGVRDFDLVSRHGSSRARWPAPWRGRSPRLRGSRLRWPPR